MASGNHRPRRGLGEVWEPGRSRRLDRCPLLCWFLLGRFAVGDGVETVQ